MSALELLVGRPLVVLTGAGVSTDSGIPDYRGAGTPVRTPMTISEFRSGPEARQRYWARAYLGWARMGHAEPNEAHRALAALEPELLITQNVDGLHEAAGSRRMVALHGRIAEVVCLDCGDVTSRVALQERLAALNPGFGDSLGPLTDRPDFDVELDDTSGFVVPACQVCGGILKPHVVFFGENVPAPTVARCYDAVDALVPTDGALLVAGSSLTVMSGFRFVRRAARAGVPVVIVNRGATRADDLATHKLDTGVGPWLTGLVAVSRGAVGFPA